MDIFTDYPHNGSETNIDQACSDRLELPAHMYYIRLAVFSEVKCHALSRSSLTKEDGTCSKVCILRNAISGGKRRFPAVRGIAPGHQGIGVGVIRHASFKGILCVLSRVFAGLFRQFGLKVRPWRRIWYVPSLVVWPRKPLRPRGEA